MATGPVTGYRPDIDGLRAIAVLAVVGYHFGIFPFASGYLGVDVFFVISGFVIADSLEKRRASSMLEFLASFWARRIKRIFPALVVVVIFSSLTATIAGSAANARFTGITGLSALIGISNLYFFRNSVDYWGTATELNYLTQTWSLGVEEQFYLLLPFFFYGFGLGGREVSSVQKSIGKWLLIFIVLASLAAYLLVSTSSPEAVFFLSPFRFWQLGIGVLLRQYSSSWQVGPRLAQTFTFTSLGLLILVLSRPSSDGVTPLTVLAASFSTAALIHIAPKGRCISRFLSVPLMLYVGRISYSLYLWHWSVLVLFRWATPLKTADTLMALILSFGLAHASYRVVEQPLRTREWKRIGGSELPIGLGMIGAMSIALAASIVVTAQVKDNPWKGVRMVHAALKCHDPKWSQNPIKDCLFASDSDLPNLYVLGDSHAGNLIPSVRAAFPTTNVLYLTDAQLSNAMLQSGDTPSGYRRLSDTLSFIDSRLKNNDIVLVAFSRDTFSYLGEDTSNGQKEFKDFAVGSPRLYDRIATRNLNFESALEVIAIHVKRVGARIVLFEGLPRLCSHAEFEIGKARSPQNPCSGDTEESLMDREGFSSMLRRVASNSGAEVIDAHQFLCPTPECHSTINGKLWTWDASPHFININDKVLAPFFRTIGKEWFEQ